MTEERRALNEYIADLQCKKMEEENILHPYSRYDIEDVEDAFLAGIRFRDEHPKNPWISVDEGCLPEINQRLLVMYADGTVNFGYYENGSFHDYRLRDDELWFRVTHWMPMPETPSNK